MSESAAPTRSAATAQSLRDQSATGWLRRNAHATTFAAVYACTLFALAAQEFVQDTWLTLSGGRDIIDNGLPWHERLTVLNHGQRWVDQQWLGKIFLYAVASLGGLRSLLVVHVVFVLGAVVLAIAVARRRGATDDSVFWVAIATIAIAPWAWQLRVQSLSYVLFVAVLVLLTGAPARISSRTWLVVPLLALWANVHGSVTLGVALAVLAGLSHVRRRPVAGLLLAASSVGALFASPYGLHLTGYYRELLLNPSMSQFISEWRPSAYPAAVPFFALAFAATWFLGRNSAALTRFEKMTLLVSGIAGLMAIRGTVWFALALILFMPRVLDAERGERAAAPVRLVQPLAVLCCAAALVMGVTAVSRLSQNLAGTYPPEAAQAVARAAANDRSLTVFASERYANWLLWRDPALSGRLVYDVRFELFNRRQFEDLALFHSHVGASWLDITDGARLLVLDRAVDGSAARALEKQPGTRVLFEAHASVVLHR